MRELELQVRVRKSKKLMTYRGTIGHIAPNHLERHFTATKPNQKWVTDISYIPTAQGNCYLSVIRDLFDNSIVLYQMSKDMTVKLVLDTIRKAIKKEKVTAELQLHSDQGSQYVSHEYHLLT